VSADQMTRDELIAYHATRRDEAIKQAQALADGFWYGEGLGKIVDGLAYDHARDAAHAARSER
jgi:hypothetical protein